jgi:membrane protein required for colicin V production
MGNWNWLDGILAGVVLVSIVTAILKGFIRELISLASVLAGLVIAALGYRRAGPWFADLTSSREVALGLGFLTLFVGTLVVGAVISFFAKKLIQKAGLQWFDRFLGGVFGLARGIVVDCVLLMVMLAFSMKAEAVQRSRLAPYVATGARVIVLAMPADLKAEFQGGFEKFRQALIENDKRMIKN